MAEHSDTVTGSVCLYGNQEAWRQKQGKPGGTDGAPILFKAKVEHSRTYRTNSILTQKSKSAVGKPMETNLDKNGRPLRTILGDF